MGHGWEEAPGGLWDTCKCKKCKKGTVKIYISSHEECDNSMELRDAIFSGQSDCGCEDFEKMSQYDLEHYGR